MKWAITGNHQSHWHKVRIISERMDRSDGMTSYVSIRYFCGFSNFHDLVPESSHRLLFQEETPITNRCPKCDVAVQKRADLDKRLGIDRDVLVPLVIDGSISA